MASTELPVTGGLWINQSNMSNKGIDMTGPDDYWQSHPIESPELITSKLAELELELDKLPEASKQGWEQAKQKCPKMLDKDFKLSFLRCEVFNSDLAAARLAKYWDKRIEIFGLERAFLPMTQTGALADDSVALGLGFMKVLPDKDPLGRGILFMDPSVQDKTLYERKSMARSVWYVIHAALEEESAQQKGCVVVGYTRNAHLSQVDRGLIKMNIESMNGCLPLRLSAFHVCHPPTFFQLVIFPIVKIFAGERMRKRVKVHAGKDENVLKKLEKYGLTNDKVPTVLGGTVELDHKNWLAKRKEAGK